MPLILDVLCAPLMPGDVWNDSAIPPALLKSLDDENKRENGAVERYIYMRFKERQTLVSVITDVIATATPNEFQVSELFNLFKREAGIRRSIDKAYEIVTYSLFETIVTELEAEVSISVPAHKGDLLKEFSALSRVLLGVDENNREWLQAAHIYRAGVTNAADRGLDMWCNFGPAVQVKHLTLQEKLASAIVNQVESDTVVIVCQDAEVSVIATVMKQIGWGGRVRGIVKESDLIAWYEKSLRGKFASQLAPPLLERLLDGFKAEFPQVAGVVEFFQQRGYLNEDPPGLWQVASIAE